MTTNTHPKATLFNLNALGFYIFLKQQKLYSFSIRICSCQNANEFIVNKNYWILLMQNMFGLFLQKCFPHGRKYFKL